MKTYHLLGSVLTGLLLLTGCSTNSGYFVRQTSENASCETWIQRTQIDTSRFTQDADCWYFTGAPTCQRGYTVATHVQATAFTKIHIDGPYKIELVGQPEGNSIEILGTPLATHHTATAIHGDTLYIYPTKENHQGVNLAAVTLRIGIQELTSIIDNGTGLVEGRNILSHSLNIISTNRAPIILTGKINLHCISEYGSGRISVLNAYSPDLQIYVLGNGTVNVSGRIALHHITKKGAGNIYILGANSDFLTINSAGSGETVINGHVNLKTLTASQSGRVYIYWVESNDLYVNLYDQARVGLAGIANTLYLQAEGASRFEGKFLRANRIYAHTRGWSHANLNPGIQLFASATDNSSIYYAGPSSRVSAYTFINGTIIPAWGTPCPMDDRVCSVPERWMTAPTFRGAQPW
jgi:hypothetical protein